MHTMKVLMNCCVGDKPCSDWSSRKSRSVLTKRLKSHTRSVWDHQEGHSPAEKMCQSTEQLLENQL